MTGWEIRGQMHVTCPVKVTAISRRTVTLYCGGRSYDLTAGDVLNLKGIITVTPAGEIIVDAPREAGRVRRLLARGLRLLGRGA